MLEVLKFVRGAVATKDLVPSLTHFHIYDGKVQGFNGRIAIEAPLPKGNLMKENITVPAKKFLEALDLGEFTMAVKGSQLQLESEATTVNLALAEHDKFPKVQPSKGKAIKLKRELIPCLKLLQPFISSDAFHAWSCGVLFKDNALYATQNTALVKLPFEWDGPSLNLPSMAVDELIRIGEEPQSIKSDGISITFFYSGSRWLTSSLFSIEWPAEVENFLKTVPKKSTLDTKKLLEAVKKIRPFCPDVDHVIKLGADGVTTLDGNTQASVKGIKCHEAKFNAAALESVLNVATTIDLSKYPEPCPFKGDDGLVGVLVGID